MYKSPVELLVTDIQHQIVKQQDEEIYQAVLHYVPNVDRAELIRALEYDRGQYEKGYADGKADAMADFVRCKDCKHYNVYRLECHNGHMNGYIGIDGFCSYGERKEDGKE